MPAKRYNHLKAGKTAGGKPPRLCVTLIPASNGTAPYTLSPGGFLPRADRGLSQIVSVIEHAGGTAGLGDLDRTQTSNIALGGSLTPGTTLVGAATVIWFDFSG